MSNTTVTTTTTEKLFFRVSDDWEKVLDPASNKRFAVNLSGDTIHFGITTDNYLSPSQIDHPHALGGSISQLRIPEGYSLFAKAGRPGTDGIIIVDTGRIIDTHTEDLRSLIDSVAADVMKLVHTVSDGDIEFIEHKAHNTLMGRRFVASEMATQQDITHLSTMAIRQLERIFAAEILLYQVRNTTHRIDYEIKNDHRYSSIARDMLRLSIKAQEMIDKYNIFDKRLEELLAISGYEGLMSDHITPITNEVNEVSSYMNTLNNMLTVVGNKYTSIEMAAAWEELIKDMPIDVQSPLTIVKNMLINIKDNRSLISANQTMIDVIQEDYPPKRPGTEEPDADPEVPTPDPEDPIVPDPEIPPTDPDEGNTDDTTQDPEPTDPDTTPEDSVDPPVEPPVDTTNPDDVPPTEDDTSGEATPEDPPVEPPIVPDPENPAPEDTTPDPDSGTPPEPTPDDTTTP